MGDSRIDGRNGLGWSPSTCSTSPARNWLGRNRLVRWWAVLGLLLPLVNSFVPLAGRLGPGTAFWTTLHDNNQVNDHQPWGLCQGFLLSSFSDGLLPNSAAQALLQQHLVRALLEDQLSSAEHCLRESTLHSPCAGPNPDYWRRLEDLDQRLLDWTNSTDPLELLKSDDEQEWRLRFLYIPTALYALRPDSTATPGKQRQRVRADGKQRRDAIVEFLSELLEAVPIDVVTLDLWDASLKQAASTVGQGSFPVSGETALSEWQPHLVYVQGGNTFWLYHCLEQGSWGDDLRRLVRRPSTVYVGSSAGAIVAGASLATACWKEWDDPRVVTSRPTYDDWRDVKGLSLIGPYSFFPHMTNEWTALVASKNQEVQHVICLSDAEVCMVDGGRCELTMLSSQPAPVVA